jgi:hypothetical protein
MRRTRPALVIAVVLVLAVPAVARARGGGFGHHGAYHGQGHHGGFHGRGHSRGGVFIGGSVFFDPFFPYWYPYAVPYPVYPYPAYSYPAPPPDDEPADDAEETQDAEDTTRASYGLVQLRGIPDGASVDLDGRFWLTADSLDDRWLALPAGTHTIAVRVRGAEPVERRIELKPGTSQVARFGPFPRDAG